MKKLFLTTLVTFMTSVVMAQMLPYQNPNLTAEQRADDLLGRLTLEEKAKLMCEACDAPVVKGNGSTLSWESVPLQSRWFFPCS